MSLSCSRSYIVLSVYPIFSAAFSGNLVYYSVLSFCVATPLRDKLWMKSLVKTPVYATCLKRKEFVTVANCSGKYLLPKDCTSTYFRNVATFILQMSRHALVNVVLQVAGTIFPCNTAF